MFTEPSKKSYACLVGAALLALCTMATAQDFAPTQTLRAPASGEGEPSGRFGSRVALESGFSVVAGFGRTGRGTELRAYQRNDKPAAARDLSLFVRPLTYFPGRPQA